MTTQVEAFPESRVPAHPVLSFAAFGGRRDAPVPSVLDIAHTVSVPRGRTAIAMALRHAGIGAGDKVLVPAYHCRALVSPIIWAGAEPVWFRVRPDTAVDFDDLASKVESGVRALLVVHYFGFPQDLVRLRAFCDERKLLLIEDCSHSFYGRVAGRPIGAWGDYAVASPWKFHPLREGGCLASSSRAVNEIPLASPGLRRHAKSALNAVEIAGQFGRLRPLTSLLSPLFRLKDWWLRRLRSRATKQPAPAQGHDAIAAGAPKDPLWDFDAGEVGLGLPAPSAWLLSRARHGRVVERRRETYARLHGALHALPGCRALHANLPDDVVPYVYPVIMENPAAVFPILKRAGVPIIRFGEDLWPGMDKGECEVAAEYSRSVFQFPCHQGVRDDELDWILAEVGRALASVAHGAQVSG
ncbi:MAG: DegT/DnrJ/EryC1/StrS family aminotransferase [Planctomycetota bacterium]